MGITVDVLANLQARQAEMVDELGGYVSTESGSYERRRGQSGRPISSRMPFASLAFPSIESLKRAVATTW